MQRQEEARAKMRGRLAGVDAAGYTSKDQTMKVLESLLFYGYWKGHTKNLSLE